MNANRPELYVVIERDEDGFYVGEVPQLRACYSQGRTIDELMANLQDVIALCPEEEPEYTPSECVGVQRVVVWQPGRDLSFAP